MKTPTKIRMYKAAVISILLFQPPWFDSELFSACLSKDRLRPKFKDSESLHDELNFTPSRRGLKRLYCAKLRDNLFNSDDPALTTKKFWAHVK